jgi:tRNA U34 5-carboxymethylaminomethyl modifying GTPase MnmE/TrmE
VITFRNLDYEWNMFNLIDTGIRRTADEIEQEGVRRSKLK